MTANQNSHFDAWERTIKVCNDNPTEVALNPVFQADKDTLEGLLPNIRQLSQRINVGNSHAEIKQKAKIQMLILGLDVCVNLSSYALTTKDADLKNKSKHSKSSLGEGKEEQILERNQNIADKARSLLTELMSKRGMKASLLTDYDAAIAHYKSVKTEPRSAIQEKSVLIAELDALMEEGDVAFNLLKASAVNLKGIADTFLTRFDKACTPIAPKTATTKTIFVVTNGVTQETIKDYVVDSAALKLANHKMSASPLLRKSHKDADIIISKEGFEPAVLEKETLTKGKSNVISVVLMPAKATA